MKGQPQASARRAVCPRRAQQFNCDFYPRLVTILLLRPDDRTIADNDVAGRCSTVVRLTKRRCSRCLRIHRINVALALTVRHDHRAASGTDVAAASVAELTIR